MKQVLLLLTIPFILSACGSQAPSKKEETDVVYDVQTETKGIQSHAQPEEIQAKVEALNEEIRILEAPFLAEIEALDAELVAIGQKDQAIWNRFWEQMDEDDVYDKSFDQAIQSASHLDDQAKNQLLASHKKREANIAKRNQIYEDMYQETKNLIEELNELYMQVDDMALVDVGDRFLPMDEVENETWEDMSAEVDKWLQTIEGMSDQDRQAYLDLEAQLRALNIEDDKDYEAYSKAEEPFLEQMEAYYQDYDQIQNQLDPIYEKMASNYQEIESINENWGQGSDAPDYEAYVASVSFLSQAEKDLYVEANQKMDKIDQELSEIQAQIWATIPEVQKSIDARAEVKNDIYWAQQAIMDKLSFTTR